MHNSQFSVGDINYSKDLKRRYAKHAMQQQRKTALQGASFFEEHRKMSFLFFKKENLTERDYCYYYENNTHNKEAKVIITKLSTSLFAVYFREHIIARHKK